MLAVKEVKKEIGNDFAAIRAVTAEEVEKMFSEITKGQDMDCLLYTSKAPIIVANLFIIVPPICFSNCTRTFHPSLL